MPLDVLSQALVATKYIKEHLVQFTPEARRLREYKNNSVIGVSKLPAEVLMMIFGYLAFPSLSDYHGKLYADLLPATQVCRRWRQVALDSPRLWKNIYCSAPLPLAKLFLERARSMPLFLMSNLHEDDDSVVSLVLDRLPRVGFISLTKCELEWLNRITSKPALRLESLSLENTLPHTADTFQFPAGAFPVLQHLSLTRYVCNSSISSLTALISLVIDCTGVTDVARLPNVTGLLAMLKNLPRLSYVTLTHAVSPMNGLMPPTPTSGPSFITWTIKDSDIRNLAVMFHAARCGTKSGMLWYTTDSQDISNITSAYIAYVYKSVLDSNSSFRFTFTLNTCRTRPYAGVMVAPVPNVDKRKPRESPPFFELRISSNTRNLRPELSVFKLFPPTSRPPALYFVSDIKGFQDDPLAAGRKETLRQLTNITEVYAVRLIDLALILCDTPAERGEHMSLPSLKKMVLARECSEGYTQEVLSKLKEQLEARRSLGAEIETSGW